MNTIKVNANNMHDVIDIACRLDETDELEVIQFNRPEPIPIKLSGEPLFYIGGPGPQYVAPPKLSLLQKVKEWFAKLWFEFKYGFEKQERIFDIHAGIEQTSYMSHYIKPDRKTTPIHGLKKAKSQDLQLGPRPNKFEKEINDERTK